MADIICEQPLIHESNNNLLINIITPHGLTMEQTVQENVLQGDTLLSIIASNQVDTIGNAMLEENPDLLFR